MPAASCRPSVAINQRFPRHLSPPPLGFDTLLEWLIEPRGMFNLHLLLLAIEDDLKDSQMEELYRAGYGGVWSFHVLSGCTAPPSILMCLLTNQVHQVLLYCLIAWCPLPGGQGWGQKLPTL